MIDIFLWQDKLFIWNSKDVSLLRKEHRIVGSLVGSLVWQPHQNSLFGLPLQLLEDEAALLVEKGTAQIVELPPPQLHNESREKSFQEIREKNYQEQVKFFKEEREEEIKQMSKTIIEGKRKKLLQKIQQAKIKKEDSPENDNPGDEEQSDKDSKANDCESQVTNDSNNLEDEIPEINEDEIIKEEVNKIKPIPQSLSLVQLFTACPWTNKDELIKVKWNYPETEKEKLRYRIFKDFWERGYFLTCGLKFGGDFLVYPGDPLRYHSFYVAVIVPYKEQIDVNSLILKARLATNVRKSVVICTSNENDDIIYTTLKWNSMM